MTHINKLDKDLRGAAESLKGIMDNIEIHIESMRQYILDLNLHPDTMTEVSIGEFNLSGFTKYKIPFLRFEKNKIIFDNPNGYHKDTLEVPMVDMSIEGINKLIEEYEDGNNE